MTRKKSEGEFGVLMRLLYCTLVAWCLSVATADVYVVMFQKQGLSELYTMMGADNMDVSAQHDVLLDSWLGTANSNFRKMHDYSHVFNGAALDLSEAEVSLLQNNPAVSRVERDALMRISTTHSPDYMALPGGAWNRSGGVSSAGENVVIGVVDTGIYPDHPSFANSTTKPYGVHPTFRAPCGTDARVPGGFCNGKIVGAQQFFATAKQNGNVSELDVNSPLDGNGHGTHCAGTAAGNNGVPVVVNGQEYGSASGVAPRARISIYKALNEEGQGFTSDIIAAIDKAVADGVDVLSLSLGPEAASVGVITYTDSFMEACLGAVNKNVFVAHAAGNSGPGVSTISSWSPWVTSVGATTTDRTYPGYLYTGDGKNFTGNNLSPPTTGTTNYTLIKAVDAVAAGNVVNSDFDCADVLDFNAALIKGRILVCSWNGLSFTAADVGNLSYAAAKSTGAVGLVLLASVRFLETLSPTYWNFQDFPAIVIAGATQFQSFQTFYAAAKQNAMGPTGRLSGNKAFYELPPKFGPFGVGPPKIAPFSSRGPDYYIGLVTASPTDEEVTDVLKPNIVAPGVDIWSAWTPLATSGLPLFRGEKWAMISGTSMATPHIAGASAIVKQMYPMWNPSAVASALSTTAVPVDSANNALVAYDYKQDIVANVMTQYKRPGNAFDFGSGFVDTTSALDPGLIFDATYNDYITFLCAEKVAVAGITTVTCPINPGFASDLNLPSITIGRLVTSRIVPRTVTNVGGRNETYTAVINEPTGVNVLVDPPTFTIAAEATQLLMVTLTAVNTSIYVNQTSFGSIYLTGSLGHKVQVPVTVTYKKI